MNHWIIALSREDMEHCIRIGAFGMNRKYVLGRIQTGDQLACYVTKECKIIAFGEVTTGYYMDTKKIFRVEGMFPDRFDFKASLLGPMDELDLKMMIDDLSFITNKLYWPVFLKSSIKEISKNDWDLIQGKRTDLATCSLY